jgi:hypothetical protein
MTRLGCDGDAYHCVATLLGGSSVWVSVCTEHTMHSRSQLNGYMLGPTEGEHLVLRGGNIFIMAEPATGSNGLAMGTQQVPTGVGIPMHRHFQMAREARSLSRRTPGTVLRIPTASFSSFGSSLRPDSTLFFVRSRRAPAFPRSSEPRTSSMQ